MNALEKLRTGFQGVASASVVFALITAQGAYADNAEPVSAAPHDCLAADGATMTPREVMQLSHNCDAVIYYGEDISPIQAEASAGSLRDYDGLDVVSVAGFPKADGVVAIVKGIPVGGTFTESQMLRGQVGSQILFATDTSPKQVASLDF